MKIKELLESKTSSAVEDLKRDLLAAKKDGKKMDYDGVAKVMEKVWDKHGISGQKLHDIFVKEVGMIPDTWIKKQRVVDESSKYLGATEKVDNISPVLGSKSKKQKKLANKFFGSN
jgi:methylphosphotriester-DNA--protein-cysteine methyltransferase